MGDIVDRAQREMADQEKALAVKLARIRAEPIPEERIEAKPDVTRCVECQEKYEKENNR